MQIINLCPDNLEAIQQAAALLVESFKEHWSNAWPDLSSGLAEVKESLLSVCFRMLMAWESLTFIWQSQ